MRNKSKQSQNITHRTSSMLAVLRTVSILVVFVTLLPALQNPCAAQDKWNATIRTGVNFPTKKLGGVDLKTGFGFDGTIGYRVMPHVFVNAGWGWNRFASNNEGNNDYEETGYILGLQFVHPISTSRLSFVGGINALYNHIEVENNNGDIIADTGHGWGWQADAGIGIHLSNKTKLIPSFRYRALSRDLKIGTAPAIPVDLNYFSGGLGLSFTF
jgi:hypothetical protein